VKRQDKDRTGSKQEESFHQASTSGRADKACTEIRLLVLQKTSVGEKRRPVKKLRKDDCRRWGRKFNLAESAKKVGQRRPAAVKVKNRARSAQRENDVGVSVSGGSSDVHPIHTQGGEGNLEPEGGAVSSSPANVPRYVAQATSVNRKDDKEGSEKKETKRTQGTSAGGGRGELT